MSQRLKLCLFADSLGPDAGTEKLVAEIAPRLDPSVIEAHVCCFESSERLSRLGKYVRTAVFPLTAINSGAGLRQVWRFHRYLNRHRIEAVHSFMNKSAIFTALASRATSCSAVITSRFNTGYWHSKRVLALFRLVNRYSTHVLTNSKAAKEQTAKIERISPEKVAVFYPGVDLSRFTLSRESPERRNGVPVVGIVANFRVVKDLPLFLRAAAIVLQAVEARFLLIGQGDLRTELHRLAEQLGIANRVAFSFPGESVPECLATVSIACLSSQSEGLPNAILEYMAAGLPVVATDVGGVSELVDDGITGFLVRERTPDAFAAPIIRLLREPELRASMGARAWERAQSEFDISAAVARLEDFYREAVISTRPRSTRPTDSK